MALDPTEIDELFVRLSKSDHVAYEQIYRHMHQPLYRYAFKITNDEGLTFDVLQDVFMKLWEKRQQIEIRHSLKALLYTMTRNQALNVLRRRGRMASEIEPEYMEMIQGSDEIELNLNAAQLDKHLKNWICALPPRRAEAFMLSRFHGLSNSEVGEIMQLSKRTVETHIVHALRFLRSKYNQLTAE